MNLLVYCVTMNVLAVYTLMKTLVVLCYTCIVCNYECVCCLHSDEDHGCVTQGQFIQTHQYHGHWYGLQMQSIEDIAREGLACVVHMELEVRDILYTYHPSTVVHGFPCLKFAQIQITLSHYNSPSLKFGC